MEKKPLKQTPLYNVHKDHKGRLVDFAGWNMPVQYKGVVQEHLNVREHVGLFDVSHMGELRVTGKNALAFLQYTTVNDVSTLVDGQAQYTMMCNEKGGIVDDILIYRLSAENYLLVVNASNIDKDFNWLKSVKDNNSSTYSELTLGNESDEFAQIAVQGPKSKELMARVAAEDLSSLKYYHFLEGKVEGFSAIISRTGYTGEFGYEIYCKPGDAPAIWQSLMEKGQDLNIMPVGLGARDSLRFEVCFPLYGHELADDISPIEAGQKWLVKLEKGDFIGKETVEKHCKEGVSRRIIGLELIDAGIARPEFVILDEEGKKEIGYVTSGTKGPSVNKSIALALVDKSYCKIGTSLNVNIRGNLKKCVVVKKPFYKNK